MGWNTGDSDLSVNSRDKGPAGSPFWKVMNSGAFGGALGLWLGMALSRVWNLTSALTSPTGSHRYRQCRRGLNRFFDVQAALETAPDRVTRTCKNSLGGVSFLLLDGAHLHGENTQIDQQKT